MYSCLHSSPTEYADVFTHGQDSTIKVIKFDVVRASEHMGVSALTGKVSNSQQSTAVRDHLLLFPSS